MSLLQFCQVLAPLASNASELVAACPGVGWAGGIGKGPARSIDRYGQVVVVVEGGWVGGWRP